MRRIFKITWLWFEYTKWKRKTKKLIFSEYYFTIILFFILFLFIEEIYYTQTSSAPWKLSRFLFLSLSIFLIQRVAVSHSSPTYYDLFWKIFAISKFSVLLGYIASYMIYLTSLLHISSFMLSQYFSLRFSFLLLKRLFILCFRTCFRSIGFDFLRSCKFLFEIFFCYYLIFYTKSFIQQDFLLFFTPWNVFRTCY